MMPFQPSVEDIIGYLMTAYYGGRAECLIRHVLTRIAYCDVRSMYPTVNVLQGLWRWWTAERLEVFDPTDQVHDFVDRLRFEDLLKPETWRELPCLVLIRPTGDRLPVRAQYVPGGDYQVGLNHFTIDASLWYTLADVIVSKLHTGRSPRIIRALGFRPVGFNPHLRPVRFRGELEIDPIREDFIKRLVEERERYRTVAREARADGRLGAARQAEAMAAGLKMTANSTAYGTGIELNRRDRSPQKLHIHGAYRFDTLSSAWEEPGRFFFPAVAVMVTGPARLVLTLLELAARRLGADCAMMDTDSLAIAATPRAPGPLAVAEAVSWLFTRLNPFSFGGSILKIEEENFALQDPRDFSQGVDRGRPEPLYYYGIAAKRYALTNVIENKVLLRKYSEHGLGHLLSPVREELNGQPGAPEPEEGDNRTTLATPGRDRRWIAEFWQGAVELVLAGRAEVPRFSWSDLPALGRFTVSHPSFYKVAQGWNTAVLPSGKRVPRPFAEQIKPTNFMLVAYLDSGTLTRGADQAIRPVAPFETDSGRWPTLPWRNLRTGEPVELTWAGSRTYLASELRVQTYHDVILRYLTHPEAKAAGGDGVGVLQPLRIEVRGADLRYIGKEANRIEEVQALGLTTDTYLHYRDQAAIQEHVRSTLARVPRRLIAQYSGLSPRQIRAFLNRKPHARKQTMERLIAFADAWEQTRGDEGRFHHYLSLRRTRT